MKHYFILGMLVLFAVTLAGSGIAEAKRFGGGMNFGMKRSVKPPAQHRQAPKQQAVPSKQRGMAGTGMMGMMGGLMLGGLLGSMFFGGAFENINFMDILIIGGILFLLYRFFAARRSPMATPSATNGAWQSSTEVDESMERESGSIQTPDIDASQFLIAAKDIYMQMQLAWNQGDTESIQKYTTEEMCREVTNQAFSDQEHQTDVAMLDAQISDTWCEGAFDYVAVSFHAMMSETKNEQHQEVSEVWIFRHERTIEDPTWYISGIQQLP
ncbi:MAG: Tim44-like domain-containing protein [Mariprofundaceae bacterium]